jgi:phage tail-like protein
MSVHSISASLLMESHINGVSAESDLIQYKLQRLPGQAKFSEVEITRVYQGYDQLYNWRLMIEEGIDSLRMVSVEILAPDLVTVVRKVTLHNCWPHRWQLPNLDASSNEPAIETISLAYERITGSLGGAGPGDAYAGEGTADGTGPIANSTASGLALEDQAFDDSFWNKPSDLSALEDKYSAALELAAQAGELFDPNEETWDPPEAVDDPTAAKHGGDGSGPVIVGNASGATQVFSDTGGGEGAKSGRGAQAEAEYGDEGESIDPNEETWDAPDSVDDPTAASNGGDGSGPVIVGNAAGTEQVFADSTSDDGVPLDPNEETWDAPEAVDDPTAARNGGDGTGPVIVGNAGGASQEFADTAGGTGPKDPNEESWDAIQGEGEQDFRDNDLTKFQGEGEQDFRDNDTTKFEGVPTEFAVTSDDGKPIDPNEETWDAPSAFEDPTAGRNGGDGSGPIGGRGAQEAFDGGAGSGPIDNEKVDYGGSAAADDPTAGKSGGDGSGPIGGRGAAAEADYGSPGSGPIGGRGEGGGGQTE